MAIVLPKPRLIQFNGNSITDHNRSEVSIDYERIEERKRMANGTLRTYFTANKKKWSWSYDMLPGTAARTVDGFWGADELDNFYVATPGSFSMTITNRSGSTSAYQVVFSDFSKNLQKRFNDHYWNVSISVEEV